jgi:hypothetical protein
MDFAVLKNAFTFWSSGLDTSMQVHVVHRQVNKTSCIKFSRCVFQLHIELDKCFRGGNGKLSKRGAEIN